MDIAPTRMSQSIAGEAVATEANEAECTPRLLQSKCIENHAEACIVSLLRSCCEESGAEYALFWSICSGRLCVSVAWAKHGGGRSFIADSSTVMLEPGEGAVGRAFNQQIEEFNEDVRCLSVDKFIRLDMAKNHNVQSLLVVPWSNYGVLEFGAHGSWQMPPALAQTFMRTTLDAAGFSGGIPQISMWQAVLWKRSRFLQSWRRRLLKLVDMRGSWQLSSWDVPKNRCTGVWNLNRNLPYIEVAPKQGFLAMMQLSDLVLATDSRLGADAMEELASILDGHLARHGNFLSLNATNRGLSETMQKHGPPGNANSDTDSFNSDCPGNAHSDTDSINSDCQSCVMKFERPQCENCGQEPAKGRLIARPVNDNEIGRWLCKGCFISTWLPTCEGASDGRLQGLPQWMSLTHSGSLINSTPPRTQRYLRVR